MLGFDVGGSHKSQQVGYESFGIRNQNQVVTDGVDTTEGTGGAGFYQDFFAHEEVSVAAAGGDVSMMTPGSAVFSTIKSGGNEFRSLNNFSWEDGSFVGSNLDDDLTRRGDTGQPNLEFWEFHTDIGGPIRRDRVWFYTAYNHFKIDKQISGVPVDLATDLGEFDNFTAKGTAKLSGKDTVIGYYQWGRKSKPSRGLSNTIGPDSILAQKSDSWMYNGQHQRVWTNRMFTDVRVGLFGFGWPMVPAVPFESNPPRQDTGTGVQTGAGWLTGSAGGPFTFDRNKPQVHATLTYFLPEKAGSHDIKAGVEILDDQSKFANNGSSGQILYLDLNGATNQIRLTDLGNFADFGSGWTGADDRNRRLALCIQDRWAVNNHLTITAGVRYDRQRPHYEDSVRNPVLLAIFPGDDRRARLRQRRHRAAHLHGVRHSRQPARAGAERRLQHPRQRGRRQQRLRHDPPRARAGRADGHTRSTRRPRTSYRTGRTSVRSTLNRSNARPDGMRAWVPRAPAAAIEGGGAATTGS